MKTTVQKISEKAKEIRKPKEMWTACIKRAAKILKKEGKI